MENIKKWHNVKLTDKLKENFNKRNINFYYLEKKEDTISLVSSLVTKEDVLSFGGSATLNEVGLLDYFRNEKYNLLDRDACSTREERDELYRKTFFADGYFLSANAITLEGEILNVDGYGNRIAAMTFGPKKVFIIVGVNKIVSDIESAEKRIKMFAGPMDCKILDKKTPCVKDGLCHDCSSPERICNKYLVYKKELIPNRMNVILINEELGF